jgi:hypothetical protein
MQKSQLNDRDSLFDFFQLCPQFGGGLISFLYVFFQAFEDDPA